ncbi:GNAT family N-acetyltransferase, partial [Brevundimonas sp.]|uniref:GNAT family N-acetyltransferase n=1 Tax=Brevundimonas sp. TaxID=1871086 RepID=UPI0028ADACF7
LTLAVRPTARRAGLGVRLVEAAVVRAAALGAERMFLEVAESNAAARALYARSGFVEMGRRRGYYSHADGRREDALTLVLNFPR